VLSVPCHLTLIRSSNVDRETNGQTSTSTFQLPGLDSMPILYASCALAALLLTRAF